MKVSCLIVTQESRWQHFARACRCFLRQTWPEKELVVAAFGQESYLDRLARYCHDLPAAIVTALTEAPAPLGRLRNLSVQAATGDIVCQWDDDDQYHPRRVELQVRALLEQGADFCLLSDYWHYFADTGELYWVDCRLDARGRRWPVPDLQVLPGTLTARRQAMIPYTADPCKEDSRFLLFATIKKRKFAVLHGAGWCYLYVFHGANTWNRQHHDGYCRQRSKVLTAADIAEFTAAARQLAPQFSAAQVLAQYDFGPRRPRLVSAMAA
jgi:glycosyltransferase involved in cell wall biosynthesis